LAVQQGLAEADAGNFIEEDEMDGRFEKMVRD
jgi:predicted transcriptional regulator